MQKPSIPKGTRDFTPPEMIRREYIFSTIRQVFKKYGYSPIETPAMENLSTLLGKYGEEGDKLLFKILNSGNFLSKYWIEGAAQRSRVMKISWLFEKLGIAKLTSEICKKGLRYDLTVPFARFIVQHRNDISFPFKRYQIQPVWRADRPQKGRYQEFYQCDADVVGSNSLLNELEFLQIIEEVFQKLGIRVQVKLNNRKILAGMAELAGTPDKLTEITVAIDKIEKAGLEKVISELEEKGLSKEAVNKLMPFLEMKGESSDLLTQLKKHLSKSTIGTKGIEELESIFSYCNQLEVKVPVELDLTLARGLNYYTGAIIEVKSVDVEIGSICGGGRYDNLTGIFGMPDVSGVGISFGADRIYDVLNQLEAYPEEVSASTKLLIINFGENEQATCLHVLKSLRVAGVASEYYPDSAKLKKQMSYANTKQIPFVLLIGEEEIGNNSYTLKDMQTGEQQSLSLEALLEKLS